MPRRSLTIGEEAVEWVESWCATPAGKPVRLGAEERAVVYRVYDAGVVEDVVGQLAGYLLLLDLCGPPWLRSSQPVGHLTVDIFTLWGCAGDELRGYLQRHGQTVSCPDLGRVWRAA